MGTTYYVNQKTNLYGVYICSKCKSIQILQFQLLGAGASTWSQKKAEEALTEPTQNLLNALQNFREKPFLLAREYDGRTITTGYQVGLANGDHPCPYCGNAEAWQRGPYYEAACKKDPETGVMLIPDCPEESRMLVFTSIESAVSAVGKINAFKEAEYKQYWAEHAAEAEQLKAEVESLKEKIAVLEPQKAAAREKSGWLYTQITEKEAQMKSLSLFSPEKKTLKTELKELNAMYTSQKDADILEERRLIGEIDAIEKQLKELKIANPGVLGEMENTNGEGELAHVVCRLS